MRTMAGAMLALVLTRDSFHRVTQVMTAMTHVQLEEVALIGAMMMTVGQMATIL